MENDRKSDNPSNSHIFDFFWLGFAWLGFLMALADFFRIEALVAYLLGWLVFCFRSGRTRKWAAGLRSSLASLDGAFLAAALILAMFVTPSVFSGRDQGAISEAAIRLAENGRLEFSTPASQDFFAIYGPGKAYNFPGFHYSTGGQLITQFPLPYISWLASFYAFAGINGLVLANAFLFFAFLKIFAALATRYLNQRDSLRWLVALTLTSFPLIWINRYTLSENLALPLVCLAILALTDFLSKPERTGYAMYLTAAGLLAFARIEGIFLLAAGLVVLASNRSGRTFVLKNRTGYVLLPLLTLSAVAALNFFRSIYFYKEVVKAILPGNSDKIFSLIGYFGGLAQEVRIFFSYGLLGFFILGAIGIAALVRAKKYRLLIPFLVISPTLIYLIDPHISADHPWMLRRFVFSLLPISLLYSVMFVDNWKPKDRRLKTAILSALLILNLPALAYFLTFSENKNLLPQISSVAGFFPSGTRSLIDRSATGDPWSMASGPLNLFSGVDSAYFFNPQDAQKSGWNDSRPTMLMVGDNNLRTYFDSSLGSRMRPATTYSITTTGLGPERHWMLWSFPTKETRTVKGQIFRIANPQQSSSCSI